VANQSILEQKQVIIDEIKDKVSNSNSVVLFDYHGVTDSDIKELRIKLKEAGADFKVYKNTLMARAFNDMKYDFNEELNGPSALAFSEDQVAPIKILSKFAKDHPTVMLKIGLIDGEVADKEVLKQYASLPSRDTLLTQIAGGMIGIVRDLSICLDLYSQQKEEN
jgi:large subunit ribosomal protein L10